MRILHVIHGLNPAYGGPPRIALNLAAAQAGSGNEVHLLCYENPSASSQIEAIIRRIGCHDRVTFHWLPPPGAVERYFAREARQWARRFLGTAPPDILHLHSVWDSLVRVVAAEAARADVPYVILLNGMLDPWSLAQKPLKKRLALLAAYRRMLDGAAALHCGNEDEVRGIAPLKLKPPTAVIPNGVGPHEIAMLPPRGTFVSAHPRLAGRRYILFLSRLHYKKGVDVLAEAFAGFAPHHSDVDLVVAGPDGGAQHDFEQAVARAGLQQRVHITGPLYAEQKWAVLVDAACFCLPSHQEGFSMAITEALACGCPPIISEGCHFPEVAASGAGLVVPMEAGAFTQAFLQIFGEPGRLAEMSRRARELALARYTWPLIAQQTLDLYSSILAGRRQPAAAGRCACTSW